MRDDDDVLEPWSEVLLPSLKCASEDDACHVGFIHICEKRRKEALLRKLSSLG
jgi:hypothetical protein